MVHLPLLPSRILPWLSDLLRAREVELLDVDGEAIIPIDLDLSPPEPPAPPAPPEPPPPAPSEDTSEAPKPKKPPPKKPAIRDAGAPSADAGDDAGDGGGADAGDAGSPGVDAGPLSTAADAGAIADAGGIAWTAPDGGATADRAGHEPDAGAPDAAAPPIASAAPSLKDPLAVAGGPARAATTDPNVQVLIASDRLRKHELGPAFGRLLTSIPEWKSFFDGTGIDPIRDFDHMLLSGPQFRDTRKVVAVLDYNVPPRKIRDAVDVVVQRSDPKGEWLKDLPVPAARARADRGDRVFALIDKARLLVVMPAEGKSLGAEAQRRLAELEKKGRFNKSSSVGVVLHIVTPRNAFKGGPIEVPESLRWMRLYVTPLPDGGVDLALEALDATPDLAARHATELSEAIERLRKPDLGILSTFGSVELFEPVKLEAKGPLLVGKLHVTNMQVRAVMGAVDKALQDLSKPTAPPPRRP